MTGFGAITMYRLYGLRLPDSTDWEFIENDPGHCLNNGSVGAFRAGRFGQEMKFLALNWFTVELGDLVFHSGEGPNEQKFIRDRWNDDLRAVAERLGLEVLQGPGWYTLPSES